MSEETKEHKVSLSGGPSMFWIWLAIMMVFFMSNDGGPNLRQSLVYHLTGEKHWVENE